MTYKKLYDLAVMAYDKHLISQDDYEYMIEPLKRNEVVFDDHDEIRRTAHWIFGSVSGNTTIMCSQCGAMYLRRYMGIRARFCPECGARIVKEKTDD